MSGRSTQYHAEIIGLKCSPDVVPRFFPLRDSTLNENLVHMRPKRGTLNFVSECVMYDSVPDSNKRIVALSRKGVKQFRKQQALAFPNALIDVNKYQAVVQGNVPACSFVGTLNGLRIVKGIATTAPQKTVTGVLKADVFTKWKKYWRKITKHLADGVHSQDLGELLDAVIKTGLAPNPTVLCRSLDYVVIRSRDAGENAFNTEFWIGDTAKLLNRYNMSSIQYDKEPWLYQVAYLIESYIEHGHGVVVNCQEHTRTAVGYNDTHILFADNYAKDDDLEIYKKADSGHSTFGASLSTTDKWFVYSWVRDLVVWH